MVNLNYLLNFHVDKYTKLAPTVEQVTIMPKDRVSHGLNLEIQWEKQYLPNNQYQKWIFGG